MTITAKGLWALPNSISRLFLPIIAGDYVTNDTAGYNPLATILEKSIDR